MAEDNLRVSLQATAALIDILSGYPGKAQTAIRELSPAELDQLINALDHLQVIADTEAIRQAGGQE